MASPESTATKIEGLQQLEIAAEHGHYLRPFAKILLAMAALREKKPDVARTQLSELVAEFPTNPLFASELAKVEPRTSRLLPLPSGRSFPKLRPEGRPETLSRRC